MGTKLVRDALVKMKLIQEQICTSQSRQKSYADHKARDVAFMVGEKVLLRVFPMKGVMRFGRKGKLSTRYIDLFEVLERVREVAYRHAFPPSPWGVRLVFHVCILQKYYGDQSNVLDFSIVKLDGNFSYNVEPVAILDRHGRKLRSNNIQSMNVH